MKAVIIVMMLGLMLLAIGCATEEQTTEPAPFPADEEFVPSAVQATGNVYKVVMDDYLFMPTTVEISVGDTVQWVNSDELDEVDYNELRYTLTMDGEFDELLPLGGTFSHTFTEVGIFHYASQLNENMPDVQDRIIQGIVIVN